MARAPAKQAAPRPMKAAPAPARAAAPAPRPHAAAAIKAQLRGASFAAGEAMLKPGAPAKKGPGSDPAEAQVAELEALLAQAPASDFTPEPEAPDGPDVEDAPGEEVLPPVDGGGDAAAAADAVDLEAPLPDLGPDPGHVQGSAPAGEPLLSPAEVASDAAVEPAAAPGQEGGEAVAPAQVEEVAASAGAAPAAVEDKAAAAVATQAEAATAAVSPENTPAELTPVAEVEQRLKPREGGAPIPGEVRESLEQASGLELSEVRVHQGGEAGATLGALGAKAATSGTDIVLKDSGDLKSARTLATLRHEVGHLAQQAEGKADDAWSPGQQANRAAMEHEADTIGAEADIAPGSEEATQQPTKTASPAPATRGGPSVRRGRARAQHGAAKKRPLRKLPSRAGGQPQFLGMPDLPNPVDVAKKVKNAGTKAAKKTADKAVDAAKWAGKKVKDGTGWASNKIASAARKIIGKSVELVMAAVKGAISKLMSVKTLIAGLKKLPGMKAAAEKVEQAVSLAERAKAEFDLAKKRAQQAARAVRKLNALVRQVRQRGPAYYAAAREAVSKVVRALSDPGTLYETGKAAVKSALAKVAEKAREQWKAARKAIAAPFKSMGQAIVAVGKGLKNAGEWVWSRREAFQKIFEGATELLSLLPPPVGPVAGLANALSHAARGDWKGAGAGLVSSIPLVGQAARAGMYGAKAAGHVQKIDRVIERAQGASKAMQASAKTRLAAMVDNWKAGRKQLAQGASRAKRELSKRLEPIREKYYDYKPRLEQYQTAVQGRLTRVQERVGPLYERYRALNEKVSRAEELYTTIKSSGGSILEGMEELVSEPAPDGGTAGAEPGASPA